MGQVQIQQSLFAQPFEVAEDSATGKREFDFYPTDPRVVTPIFEFFDFPQVIFECASGHGAIAEVFRDRGHIILESDIQWDMGRSPKDATQRNFWEHWATEIAKLPTRTHDWMTVTNPPFPIADQILPLAFEYSPRGVAFLLRLSYIEPTEKRENWLIEYCDHLRFFAPVNPRVVFKPGGNDSATTAWYVFDKKFSWKELGIPCPFQMINQWRPRK